MFKHVISLSRKMFFHLFRIRHDFRDDKILDVGKLCIAVDEHIQVFADFDFKRLIRIENRVNFISCFIYSFFQYGFKKLITAPEIIMNEGTVDSGLISNLLRGSIQKALLKENALGCFFDQCFRLRGLAHNLSFMFNKNDKHEVLTDKFQSCEIFFYSTYLNDERLEIQAGKK